MSDVIPPPPPRRDSGGCWKWGAISCAGIGCLVVIAVVVMVAVFMKSKAGQDIMRASVTAAQVQQELPAVAGALAKYRNDKGDYPKKLEDLAPKYISADRLRWSGGPFAYTKPPKDAPDSFPVVTVEIPIMEGGPPVVMRLLKDGTVEGANTGRNRYRVPAPTGGN